MAKISDIKVLGPGDKLIIKIKGEPPTKDMIRIAEIVKDFLEGKVKALYFNDKCSIYIMKKGSKALLKDELNKELKKEA